MDRFWKYKLDHVIFWTATVLFHFFTRAHLIDKAGLPQVIGEVLVRNGLLAIVIYTNLLVLIPAFARQQKILTYLLFLILAIAFYITAKGVHDVFLYGYVLDDAGQQGMFHNAYYNFSIALFYVAFSVALQLSKEWYFQRELIRRIEVEKLNTELEYLKAQINPHFLFNSINTIYFQIDKQNTIARDTLSTFSEMLRYQLYECNGKEIPIEQEINYLRNYVALQRLRKDENYRISFQCDESVRGFTIAPLLLIPFVENAFKHVSHDPEKNEITIVLAKQDDTFRLNVFNTKDSKAVNGTGRSGIGLKNVTRMLELLYKDRHSLTTRETPESFSVNLTLHIV